METVEKSVKGNQNNGKRLATNILSNVGYISACFGPLGLIAIGVVGQGISGHQTIKSLTDDIENTLDIYDASF